MRIRIGEIRQVIREVLRDSRGVAAKDVCRVCGGEGEMFGSPCATCGGSGEELDYGATRGGIGRGPLPWRL